MRGFPGCRSSGFGGVRFQGFGLSGFRLKALWGTVGDGLERRSEAF